jgi:hypothetical protein
MRSLLLQLQLKHWLALVYGSYVETLFLKVKGNDYLFYSLSAAWGKRAYPVKRSIQFDKEKAGRA